jgi:hypothetical protein
MEGNVCIDSQGFLECVWGVLFFFYCIPFLFADIFQCLWMVMPASKNTKRIKPWLWEVLTIQVQNCDDSIARYGVSPVLILQWTDIDNAVLLSEREIFSHEEEWNYIASRKMNGTGDHHVEWDKPSPERHHNFSLLCRI